jgi:hypothetical protein
MTKLLVVTSFAAAALIATPIAACEWNREASTPDPAVAAATTTTQQTTQAAVTEPQAPNVASDESARKPTGATVPVVLITDRH